MTDSAAYYVKHGRSVLDALDAARALSVEALDVLTDAGPRSSLDPDRAEALGSLAAQAVAAAEVAAEHLDDYGRRYAGLMAEHLDRITAGPVEDDVEDDEGAEQ